jgi:hypothetical protein
MSTSVEASTIELHLRHCTQAQIVAALRTGKPRIFHQSGVIPELLGIGRPSKRLSDETAFVEARTLQNPSLSSVNMVNEITTYFGVQPSQTTVCLTRKELRYKYRPPRHNQALNDRYTTVQLDFCQKMLKMREDLPKIHFSDGSRVVLEADRQWIWCRSGEDNLGASMSSIKFPPTVIVFAVIGIAFKSDLMLVEGSIDTDRYIQNIDGMSFIKALDAMHEPFSWVIQQAGAPAHISQRALDWLEESVDVIVEWPANSPDLSLIKVLWAILKS